MSASTSILGRSRSLRLPAVSSNLKPSSSTPQQAQGPSYVALFLTNLRLLDLDLREDWPDITTLTFSTKDAQQNQKKRIHSVEWALYQLFALWDPEDTRNKLRPFFPPLEHLQSLNLRAALFRSLDHAKKSGVLGRDTVLRKTMLDECKGERLEEVLAVFSNAVLRKFLEDNSHQDHAIVMQLAVKNFSYSGERGVLSTLILAHKASLSKLLENRNDSRARYNDFTNLLKLKDRQIIRRHEQLKEVIGNSGSMEHMSKIEVTDLQDFILKSWSGNERWLETIIHGDPMHSEGLFATPFDDVWNHVEAGSIGDLEAKDRPGLLDELSTRVKDHESRLARWQDFGSKFTTSIQASPPKNPDASVLERKKIDLGFTQHQAIQIDRSSPAKNDVPSTPAGEKYRRLIDNMKSELANTEKSLAPTAPSTFESAASTRRRSAQKSSSRVSQESTQILDGEAQSTRSENDDHSPEFANSAEISTSQTLPPKVVEQEVPTIDEDLDLEFQKPLHPERKILYAEPASEDKKIDMSTPKEHPEPPRYLARTPSPIDITKHVNAEEVLVCEILNSMSAASPSPKKLRHTLSLAERTRLSMSRNSHSKFSDLNDEYEIGDIPRLPIKSRQSIAQGPIEDAEPPKHADLIERTRNSMAGFDAAQKKAQLERRRSVKDEKKKQRQSSYFPKVEEEAMTPDASAVEMMEGDPDYENVFKSRPRIKTSPALSPIRDLDREYQD